MGHGGPVFGESTDGIALLDVAVEGVEHGLEVRVPYQFHVGRGLGHGVEEVALKAVERLDGEEDAGLLRDVRQRAMYVGGALHFVFRGASAGEDAKHLVVGAAEKFDAGVVAAFDDALEVVETALPVLRRGADRVVGFVRRDGDGGGFEAVVLERLADLFEVPGIAGVEDGDLRRVIAGLFEFGQQRELRLDEVGGPEK